jgi:hypothetical protein
MSPQQVFSVANAVALLAWIMLAILPGQPWVTKAITTKFVPALLAVLYTTIAVSLFGRTPGGFSTLAAVGLLFSNPWLLLAGWVHYLAFDLLVGSWELEDARTHGIPHWMVVPCLALTFLFGPAGWLLYTILRSTRRPSERVASPGPSRALVDNMAVGVNSGVVTKLAMSANSPDPSLSY